MTRQPRSRTFRIGTWQMRYVALALAVASWSGSAARASSTLVYSFENGDQQGFFGNGASLESEVALDTIGATEGTSSLKFALVPEDTFAGVLTSTLPEAIGDPPGVEYVLFDLTIPTPFGEQTGFARIGVTIFGSNPDLGAGLQAQFRNNEVSLGDLPAGTHQIRINLDDADQFGNKSFNELFGAIDDPLSLFPTGFQLYINKSNTVPFTVYFDNIRVGEYDADFNVDDNVNGIDFGRWKANFGTGPLADADGDGDSDGADFLVWQRQFGRTGAGVVAVPEPTGMAVAAVSSVGLLVIRRRR